MFKPNVGFIVSIHTRRKLYSNNNDTLFFENDIDWLLTISVTTSVQISVPDIPRAFVILKCELKFTCMTPLLFEEKKLSEH